MKRREIISKGLIATATSAAAVACSRRTNTVGKKSSLPRQPSGLTYVQKFLVGADMMTLRSK